MLDRQCFRFFFSRGLIVWVLFALASCEGITSNTTSNSVLPSLSYGQQECNSVAWRISQPKTYVGKTSSRARLYDYWSFAVLQDRGVYFLVSHWGVRTYALHRNFNYEIKNDPKNNNAVYIYRLDTLANGTLYPLYYGDWGIKPYSRWKCIHQYLFPISDCP